MTRRPTQPEETGLPQLLTSGQVAKALQVAPTTLGRWRAQGIGPKCVWLSERGPRYFREDLEEWLEQQGR